MADFKKRLCAQSCTIEKNGFNAFYYPGNLADDMAIISVGGASCDEKISIAMSGFLRKAGYNVFKMGIQTSASCREKISGGM